MTTFQWVIVIELGLITLVLLAWAGDNARHH
jgi:hypothetical protein